MNAFACAFVSALLAVPSERHIDCSGWMGHEQVRFEVFIRTMDGTVYKSAVELFPGSDATDARDLIWLNLERSGWRGRTVGKGILVLEGSKKSPIRSVEFTGKDWKPDVRWVPLVPQKK